MNYLGMDRCGERNPMFGKVQSEETRKKIGLARLGKKRSAFSQEWRNKIGAASKGRCTGAKSHLWKGGVTPVNKAIRSSWEYKQWRIAVFKRDGFKCVMCGDDTGGNLQADHIKPFSLFPQLRLAIDNGRTLCISCHKKTDTYLSKIKSYEL